MFGVAAAVGLAVPWLSHAIPETARFTRARERGTTETSVTRDLFRPPYRRPAVGLLVAATLRPVGTVALGSWAFFHAVENLAIPPATVSLIYLGAALSVLGNPFGAWMSDRFGRRPTLVANVLLLLATGVAYYWVPAGPSGPGAWILGFFFATFAFASQAFSVANRLLDSECFPTHLRATYTGANAMAEAAGTVVSYLALYGLLVWTDHLPLAVTLLASTSVLASIPVFLATAPETRGLTLDEASGEPEDDDPPVGSAAAS
jgi:MFS family permease